MDDFQTRALGNLRKRHEDKIRQHVEPESPVTPERPPRTGDTVLVQIPGRTDLRPAIVASVGDGLFWDTSGYGYAVAGASPANERGAA